MNTSRAKSDINITPLIDIVLVLLIVFIVLVPCLPPTLKAALPQRGNAVPPGPGQPVPLVLTLDAQGRLFLQQEEISLASLPDKLVPPVLLQPLGLRKVFLKVAGDLTHAHAVRVLDQIRVAEDLAKVRTRTRFGPDVDGGEIHVGVTLLKGEGVV